MEYKEKERIMTEIDHDVDHKRNLLSQLKDEVNEKEDLIEELNWTYERKTSELKMVQERPATSKHAPQARDDDEVDDLDEMLEEYIWRAGCTVPLWRLGGGYYMFGTRKIFAKVMNGQLVVWVGGGYMVVEEFIENYASIEESKYQQRNDDPYDDSHDDVEQERSKKTTFRDE